MGRLVGEEFSKSFFPQHFRFAGQTVRFRFGALPDQALLPRLQHEMNGLPAVLGTRLDGEVVEAELSGSLSATAGLAQAAVAAALPASLYEATPGRRVEIVKNPALLKKLEI